MTTRIRWENHVIEPTSVPPEQDEPEQDLKQEHEETSHIDNTTFDWPDLPYSQEKTLEGGIYEDLEENKDPPKTIGFINKDTMIKFGAVLKGSTEENSILTYLDTGAEENVAGPSAIAGLQPLRDYIEVPRIALNGADGHPLSIMKRIQFLNSK